VLCITSSGFAGVAPAPHDSEIVLPLCIGDCGIYRSRLSSLFQEEDIVETVVASRVMQPAALADKERAYHVATAAEYLLLAESELSAHRIVLNLSNF
jgi:hypothetical protein